MIALAKPRKKLSTAERRQAKFLEMPPTMRRQARIAFRHEPPDRRQEMIAEVVANCWVSFVRLMERGLEDAVYPTPLVQFAIRQVRSGRKVGSKLNVRDISSPHCQISKGIHLGRLDHYDRDEGAWKEVLIEDRRAGPAEIAATKIDFGTWLGLLPRLKRRVAQTLATGETTGRAAERFGVSLARISQLRSELRASWQDFQGEPREALAVA